MSDIDTKEAIDPKVGDKYAVYSGHGVERVPSGPYYVIRRLGLSEWDPHDILNAIIRLRYEKGGA